MLDRARYSSYNRPMNKQAISVSLDPGNLLWLRAQAVSSGCRSASELLDRLIRAARTGDKGQNETIRSVVGTVRIAESDPSLATADAAIRALFPVAPSRRSTPMGSRGRPQKGGRRTVLKGRRHG